MQCPECGSEVADNALFCPACGAQFSLAATTDPKNRTGLFLQHLERIVFGASIVLVVVGAFVIHAFWHPSSTQLAQMTLEHTNPFITLLFVALGACLIISIVSAQAGRIPFIRRIPGLNAIDDAVGRATEMGRPILFSTGLSGFGIVSLQALAIAAHVGRFAARFNTRYIVPICDQTMMPVTEQVLREVYTTEGHPEAYRPEDIRFLSDRQFAYAAGVTGILHRERPAASFLFGQFFAESLILAENGQAVGAIQVAGTPELLQTPFFVVSCDYTIIGDEFYAATAYLSHEPTLLGSLVGQDMGKALMLVLMVVGLIWAISRPDFPILQWLGEH